MAIANTDPKSFGLVNTGAEIGGSLGKYYTSIRLYDYERQNPFRQGPETTEAQTRSTIILPLPIQLYDRTSATYSQQNMGVLGDLLNIAQGGDSDGIIGAAALRALDSFLPTIMNMGGQLGRVASQLVDTRAITTAVEQQFGVIANPNPVVKFMGPQLRSFNYTWYLSPKSEAESKSLDTILRTLKAASLPGTNTESANALLKIPKLAQMNFYPWDRKTGTNEWGWTSESIIKMKRCHISNVSVNYNPANVPSFFYDAKPVIVELSMELQEVEYFVESDWRDNIGSARGNINVSDITGTVSDISSRAGEVGQSALGELDILGIVLGDSK